MEFGNAYLDASGLSRALRPSLERLTRTLDESVSAIVLDGCDARIVGTAVPPGRVIPSASASATCCPPSAAPPEPYSPPAGTRRPREAWRARRAADRWTPVSGRPHRPRLPAPSGRKPTSRPGPRRRTRAAGRWTTNWSPRGWSRWRSPSANPTAAPCARSACSRTSRHSADDLRAHALTEMNRAAQDIADALYGTSHPCPPRRRPSPPRITDAKPELGPSFLQALARAWPY
ncbi:hypothetical protein O1M63_10345 [Streptomyces mirabilis]|nr:hypothetical protein [Streptomyces mirabilis]